MLTAWSLAVERWDYVLDVFAVRTLRNALLPEFSVCPSLLSNLGVAAFEFFGKPWSAWNADSALQPPNLFAHYESVSAVVCEVVPTFALVGQQPANDRKQLVPLTLSQTIHRHCGPGRNSG